MLTLILELGSPIFLDWVDSIYSNIGGIGILKSPFSFVVVEPLKVYISFKDSGVEELYEELYETKQTEIINELKEKGYEY